MIQLKKTQNKLRSLNLLNFESYYESIKLQKYIEVVNDASKIASDVHNYGTMLGKKIE